MRKNYIHIALSCAALLTLASCVEENLEPVKPAQVGDEIIFGVRAGFEDSDPKTKTEYGGKESEYVYNNKTYERINWVAGDMVEIYSPDAANNSQSFHYTVTKTNPPTSGDNGENSSYEGHLKDYAYLTRYGDAGIQWGAAETHRFYAMYPSSVMWTANPDPEVTVGSGVYMDYVDDSPIVHGIIPIVQTPTKQIYESSSGHWVVPADMKYAYMVARGEATKADASVALTFVPIVTAVEIELILDSPADAYETVDAVNIDYVQVIGNGIAGAFTADLSQWEGTAYPECINSQDGSDVITIDVRDATQNSRTIPSGGSLTFTVFVRPGADIDDLNVSFFDGTRFIGKDLKGADITKNLKTRIVDVRLPKKVTELPVYSDKWMDRISDDIEMKALSLPGSGNSFSYGYNNNDRKYFATQSRDMTIDKQWNLGIRAFEIVSDRPAHQSDNSEDLGTMDVECNKQKVTFNINNQSKSSVKDALLAIAAKVRPAGTEEEDLSETAVVILTYQPHEGRVRSRNSKYYAYALKNLYDSIENDYPGIFELYTPDMTLEEARGRILLMCRINQRHEGETDTQDTDTGGENQTSVSWANANFITASNYLNQNGVKVVLVDGCGTGKDKWGRRGYTVGEGKTPVLDIDSKVANVAAAENGKVYSYVEQYMNAENWGNNVNFPSVDVTGETNPGNADFTYSTNQSAFNCWFQEWARVAYGGGAASGGTGDNGYFRHSWEEWSWSSWRNETVYSPYWYNSYNEKLGNAAYTFKKAINDDTASMLYVNWLGGYLIDQNQSGGYTLYSTANSSWGGDGGDVQGLANKLNPAFMNIVENSGWENKTGPTGIVMIDYIGATPGAELLPGTILMNNFRHDAAAGGGIINPDDVSGGGSGNTGGGSGDDVDNEIEE